MTNYGDISLSGEIVPYRRKYIAKHESSRAMAAIEYLIESEYTDLLKAADNYPEHQLLMKLLWQTGLRISEAMALTYSDIYPDGINVKYGKGRKQRMVPCQAPIIGELMRYGEDHKQVKIFQKITTEPGALYMMRRYAKYIGLSKRIHPHLFRHSFAINFIRQTGNPWALQKIGGWADMEIIKVYMRLATDAPREAINKMYFPEIK